MGSSHKALALAAALAIGCQSGDGEGYAAGVVSAPDCGLDAEPYELRPGHFVIRPIDDFVEIRMQRGSEVEDRSDLILIFVGGAREVKTSRLGEAIPVRLSADEGVAMSLALNDTCNVYRNRERPPVNYVGVSGSITFESLYFPDVDGDAETAAQFTDVRFEDPSHPDERYAVLSGELRFRYRRGRPPERLP